MEEEEEEENERKIEREIWERVGQLMRQSFLHLANGSIKRQSRLPCMHDRIEMKETQREAKLSSTCMGNAKL